MCMVSSIVLLLSLIRHWVEVSHEAFLSNSIPIIYLNLTKHKTVEKSEFGQCLLANFYKEHDFTSVTELLCSLISLFIGNNKNHLVCKHMVKKDRDVLFKQGFKLISRKKVKNEF